MLCVWLAGAGLSQGTVGSEGHRPWGEWEEVASWPGLDILPWAPGDQESISDAKELLFLVLHV